MTFQEIYQQEKAATEGLRPFGWLQRVACAAIVSTETAYQWATGWRFPSKAAAELVSRELGIPADELFPETNKKKGAKQ